MNRFSFRATHSTAAPHPRTSVPDTQPLKPETGNPRVRARFSQNHGSILAASPRSTPALRNPAEAVSPPAGTHPSHQDGGAQSGVKRVREAQQESSRKTKKPRTDTGKTPGALKGAISPDYNPDNPQDLDGKVKWKHQSLAPMLLPIRRSQAARATPEQISSGKKPKKRFADKQISPGKKQNKLLADMQTEFHRIKARIGSPRSSDPGAGRPLFVMADAPSQAHAAAGATAAKPPGTSCPPPDQARIEQVRQGFMAPLFEEYSFTAESENSAHSPPQASHARSLSPVTIRSRNKITSDTIHKLQGLNIAIAKRSLDFGSELLSLGKSADSGMDLQLSPAGLASAANDSAQRAQALQESGEKFLADSRRMLDQLQESLSEGDPIQQELDKLISQMN
ncbi:MAG: hypothetical protein ACO1N5_07280 [Noviherbaspirillum sp.]